MTTDSFRCYLVRKSGSDAVEASIEHRPVRDLPAGDVLIRVTCSSLNYKDALAATGHPGIVKRFPHVPGIDVAGSVVSSDSPRFRGGEEVIVTGYELGSGRWGGWAELIRVPAEWVVPLPTGLTPAEAMTWGTAGFTAAQCVLSLQQHGITPDRGDVVVTGATGGVGSLSILLLARLGYQVTAVSGKADREPWLRELGATDVIGRQAVADESGRPLLASRWAGGIDTVGGVTLSTLLRSLQHRGCVAACGLVGGSDLPITVYPFILRGATLDGIDSAMCPYDRRVEIWSKLAGDWKADQLSRLATHVRLEGVGDAVQQMLAGQTTGRVIVNPQA